MRLAGELGADATICIDDPAEAAEWAADASWPAGVGAVAAPERGAPWDLVILDRRRTTKPELEGYAACGPVLALDEGGEARDLACYLLDTIPGSAGSRRRRTAPANREAPELLDLPAPARSSPPRSIRSVLVSFGGEDPARLTEGFVRMAVAAGLERELAVTVVEGPRFGRTVGAPGMRLLRSPPSLADLYAQADLVVTSFGLTAFESLAAGTPVALAHPSGYHARLARQSDLFSLGRRRPAIGRFRRLQRRPELLWGPVERFQARVAASPVPVGAAGLARLARELAGSLAASGTAPGAAGGCPLCPSARGPVLHRAVARAPDRTTFRCPRTGLYYAVPAGDRKPRYGTEYFFEEYRAQYGRTYLEDFESIAAAGRARMAVIRELAAPPGPVLDVGCAYGPFLVAAREAGFRPVGLDISREAVEHVRRELRIEALCADFQDAELEPLRALGTRCLTMWYVIEHFARPAEVLRRVNALLPAGGLFAFSTPSSSGVSARSRLGSFLERSPLDHLTIWSPASARKVLGRFGFRVARIRVTGHHPERSRLLAAAPTIGRKASELLGLGDTFEVYAIKVAHAGADGADSRRRLGGKGD
jgi:2-polyprenyl-3-methyl-5-hydroxy-6-metoxy-1,4-benzoquinol methylase